MANIRLHLQISDTTSEALERAAQAGNRAPADLAGTILARWLRENGYLSFPQEGIPPEDLNASNDD